MKPTNPPPPMMPSQPESSSGEGELPLSDGRRLRVLVVEDDSVTRKYIVKNLEKSGISVAEAVDGESAFRALDQEMPCLVVLDIMLPGMDGFQVCQKIRERGVDIPILMLTSRGDDADKIAGLEVGADDYMVKPFNPDELIARIKAILRRSLRTSGKSDVLTHRDVRIEFRAQRVFKGEKEVFLTPREFALLAAFLQNPNRVLSREELFHWIWGKDHHGSAKGLDVYVRKLREKIEVDPSNPTMIMTAWGVGYTCK